MKWLLRLILLFLIFAGISGIGQVVQAASSMYDFAMPTEVDRQNSGIALIRQDNTMKILKVDGQVLACTMNPAGNKVAYTIRDSDRLKVIISDPDGNSIKQVCDYKSDTRHMNDFIDLRFIKNGQILIMTKFIKDEMSFLEYDVAKNRTRFLNKTIWKAGSFNIHNMDAMDNGLLVFKVTKQTGGDVLQQFWTAGAYKEGTSVFMELEAPPTIMDIVPDLKNKRLICVGVDARHVSGKNVKKSLMIVKSMADEPQILLENELFRNLAFSNDGKYVLWRSNPTGSPNQFKRYNLATGEVNVIPPEAEGEKKQKDGAGPMPVTSAPPAKPTK